MNAKFDQKRLMVQYLFGELPASERAELEEAYWNDSETFQELVSLENELIDEYLLGGLSPSQRTAFERSFLSDPARRERVETARSLVAYSAAESLSASNPFSLGSKKNWAIPWVASAAVFLVMFSGMIWLVLSNRHMANELVKLRQQHAKPEADQQHKTVQMLSPLQDVVPFTLDAATSRGSGPSPSLLIPARALYVLLRIPLEHEPQSPCNVVVETADGRVIWRQNGAEVQSFTDGAREVAVVIPSHLLKHGDYILTISNAESGKLANAIAGFSFQVEGR